MFESIMHVEEHGGHRSGKKMSDAHVGSDRTIPVEEGIKEAMVGDLRLCMMAHGGEVEGEDSLVFIDIPSLL
jgi:hypothetical protein